MRITRQSVVSALRLSLIGAGLAPPALAGGFDPATQSRSVDVTITQRTLQCVPPFGCSELGSSMQSDSEVAPDFLPFSATAQVPPFTQISATQDSAISVPLIAARGDTVSAGSGALSSFPGIFTTTESESSSTFSTSFDVDVGTPYQLTGTVSVTGGLTAAALARVRLWTSGGTLIAEMSAETDPGCQDASCATVGPFPLDQTGVLFSGAYVLEAEATGEAAPFFFAGNFLPLLSTAHYEVALSAQAVPSLGHAGLAALVLLLALTAATSRLRRQPLPVAEVSLQCPRRDSNARPQD